MYVPVLRIRLDGVVDQARLEALLAALRLRPRGRFGDAQNHILGIRTDAVDGGQLDVMIYRQAVDGPWSFHVNAEGQPSGPALQAVESELAGVAGTCGLAVGEVRRFPVA